MKALHCFFFVFLYCSLNCDAANAQRPCDWVRVATDVNFCLIEGNNVDGRTEMREAISTPPEALDITAVMNKFAAGFDKCQPNQDVRDHMHACRGYDAKRVLNGGRARMGLPPYP
jgi:hypothetical protein